ncbi:alpha/beta hydrolase [Halobacteriovorax sp. JY17]|uniref:alpha/beta fold hydrolase n=1 Tax=Halobacteriovorax sp. JY17 TaxID=2014617 RepID=UPI000C69C6D4|nr:alpha/beta hydrolase [Halobacteriovorax sp. JY17]PIK16221.1 MAG: alpha/beta hydrolase [Halobacteriovorax sp. JY17]
MEKVNWVLLRGLAREKGHWVNFDTQMKDAFQGEVLCLDLPGAGDSLHEAVPLSIKGMTDFIRAKWLVQRGNEKKWSLLAISLGGMIAMDWCARYPKDFELLVTINSSTKKLSLPFERISPLAIKSLAKTIFINDPHKREELILNLITNHDNVDQSIAKEWGELAKKRQIKISNFFKQLFAASKFNLPKKIQTPYLVLASENDRFTNCKCSKKISKYFNVPIHLHPTAGHDLPIDDGEWIIEKIRDFKKS